MLTFASSLCQCRCLGENCPSIKRTRVCVYVCVCACMRVCVSLFSSMSPSLQQHCWHSLRLGSLCTALPKKASRLRPCVLLTLSTLPYTVHCTSLSLHITSVRQGPTVDKFRCLKRSPFVRLKQAATHAGKYCS